MEIKDMLMSDIETRSAELTSMVEQPDADIEAITAEVQELEERKAQILGGCILILLGGKILLEHTWHLPF